MELDFSGVHYIIFLRDEPNVGRKSLRIVDEGFRRDHLEKTITFFGELVEAIEKYSGAVLAPERLELLADYFIDASSMLRTKPRNNAWTDLPLKRPALQASGQHHSLVRRQRL